MSLDSARSAATATRDTDRNTDTPRNAAAAAAMLNGSGEESDAASVTSNPDPSTTAFWPHSPTAAASREEASRAPATFPFNHRKDRVHHRKSQEVIKGAKNRINFAERDRKVSGENSTRGRRDGSPGKSQR